MKLIWKSAIALSLGALTLGAASAPAQAQYYGGGWHDSRGYRPVDRRYDDRRWDDRRHDRRWRDDRRWRGDRGYYRGRYAYRQRCWTEWRYNGYRDRRVRVRVCN